MNDTNQNNKSLGEDGYSSQSQSDLLATAMEKQLTPAELIYEWDMHLQKFSRITTEFQQTVSTSVGSIKDDYVRISDALLELEQSFKDIKVNEASVVGLQTKVSELRVRTDALELAVSLLGGNSNNGGVLAQIEAILAAVANAEFIQVLEDAVQNNSTDIASLVTRMGLLESRHATDIQELINNTNIAVNSLDLKYKDQFDSLILAIATETTARGNAIESLKQSIANNLSSLVEGGGQLDVLITQLSNDLNTRIDELQIPVKAKTVTTVLDWNVTSIESELTLNKTITMDGLSEYSNLLITPNIKVVSTSVPSTSDIKLVLKQADTTLAAWQATQRLVSIEDGAILIDLQVLANSAVQLSLENLTDDEISISFVLESNSDSEFTISSAAMKVCAFN